MCTLSPPHFNNSFVPRSSELYDITSHEGTEDATNHDDIQVLITSFKVSLTHDDILFITSFKVSLNHDDIQVLITSFKVKLTSYANQVLITSFKVKLTHNEVVCLCFFITCPPPE